MRFLFVLLVPFFVVPCQAQLSSGPQELFGRLKTGAPVPDKLLSTRSVVLYPHTMTEKELENIQKSFQRTGIDAVAYYDIDMLVAGRDVSRVLAFNFSKRDITNLVFFQKETGRYTSYITVFNAKENFVDQNQSAWYAEDPSLAELLKKIYRSAAGSLEKKNLLINEYPETELAVNPIAGRRSEFFAIDLKVDQLAVPKTGNEAMDKELEALFANYPFKYKLTPAGASEKDLRSQGNLYILCYVHARGSLAKELLGYDTSKPESAYVSVTFPSKEPVLKSLPAETPVYKFYFRHIDSGNVFLGTKWDADVTWQEALRNHITAFKSELKIN